MVRGACEYGHARMHTSVGVQVHALNAAIIAEATLNPLDTKYSSTSGLIEAAFNAHSYWFDIKPVQV